MKMTINQIIVFLWVLLMINLAPCKGQDQNLIGNVYTLNGSCENWTPIYLNAIRINEVFTDSIVVTIKRGKEQFEHRTFRVSKNNNIYQPTIPVYFYDKNKKINVEKFELQLSDQYNFIVNIKINNTIIKWNFIYTYKTEIDLNTIYNVFYGEDGYGLCKTNK